MVLVSKHMSKNLIYESKMQPEYYFSSERTSTFIMPWSEKFKLFFFVFVHRRVTKDIGILGMVWISIIYVFIYVKGAL